MISTQEKGPPCSTIFDNLSKKDERNLKVTNIAWICELRVNTRPIVLYNNEL